MDWHTKVIERCEHFGKTKGWVTRNEYGWWWWFSTKPYTAVSTWVASDDGETQYIGSEHDLGSPSSGVHWSETLIRLNKDEISCPLLSPPVQWPDKVREEANRLSDGSYTDGFFAMDSDGNWWWYAVCPVIQTNE